MSIYKSVKTGELEGSTIAKQLPDVATGKFKLKARSENDGSVYVGFSRNVTKPNTKGDSTTGYELDAGDETEWIQLDNLNKLWIICDNAGDEMTYLALV